MSKIILKNIHKSYADKADAVSDFNLEIAEGEFIVFVGPSGCGKSTTLRMISGLESISSGSLYINDKLMNDVEPKDRDIAMVFQSYALFPFLNVYDNISFGLKIRKKKRVDIDAAVRKVAEILGLSAELNKKISHLSGGQKQRVALGRAIVRDASIFLLDEPLSNLDAKLRVQMRSEIKRIHKNLRATSIYVTHDQVEAMTMADRIVVLDNGKIQQIGSPEDVYLRPMTKFVASFIGSPIMNFISLESDGAILRSKDKKAVLDLSKDTKHLAKHTGDVILGIRPEDAFLGGDFDFDIEFIELLGSHYQIYGKLFGDDFVLICDSVSGMQAGSSVKIGFNEIKMHFFDALSEKRIELLSPKDTDSNVKNYSEDENQKGGIAV